MSEYVEDHRRYAHEAVALFFPLLDGILKEFFAKNPEQSRFPAIDIGSGPAAHVVKLALHFREPLYKRHELVWYPTNWTGGDGTPTHDNPIEFETRAVLKYCLEETKDKVDNVLFTDKNGQPVYKGDLIELSGLKTTQFNGKHGVARGVDPKSEGRIAVQLTTDWNDRKSFKQQNITYLGGEISMENAVLRTMTQQGSYKEFFQGLLDRTTEIDILKHKTWSNLQEVEGKCALITCSNLLTQIGYRDPTAFRDTMEFASRFLCQDGYLLQYDAINFGGFGEDLEAFPSALGLKLEHTFDSTLR